MDDIPRFIESDDGMNVRVKNRWGWVVILWAAALLIFFWDYHRVDFILALNSQNHALQHEEIFRQQHARRLERIQGEYAQLFLPADSVQLGVLTAQSFLLELTGELEIAPPQFSIPSEDGGEATTTMNISVEAPREKILLFLRGLHRFLFLDEKQITLKIDSRTGTALCEVTAAIRCRPHADGEIAPAHAAPIRSAL